MTSAPRATVRPLRTSVKRARPGAVAVSSSGRLDGLLLSRHARGTITLRRPATVLLAPAPRASLASCGAVSAASTLPPLAAPATGPAGGPGGAGVTPSPSPSPSTGSGVLVPPPPVSGGVVVVGAVTVTVTCAAAALP